MLSGSRELVPLSGRLEVLVDLSWKHPPGLDAIDFLGLTSSLALSCYSISERKGSTVPLAVSHSTGQCGCL